MGLFDKMFGRGASEAEQQQGAQQRFNELKQKYQTVLTTADNEHIQFLNLHVQDNKLFIQGTAPSEDIKNEVWNQIKLVDPSFADLMCDLTVDASLAPPQQVRTYTVKPGDSLWKIAQEFYGNGIQFPRIIAGNPGRLKDEKTVIHPGDVLIVPN